jgi:hypothetical protein
MTMPPDGAQVEASALASWQENSTSLASFFYRPGFDRLPWLDLFQ